MSRYISVCFHSGNGYSGRMYDFQLMDGEAAPAVGDCIRLISEDRKWLYSASRVQVQKNSNTTTCPRQLLKKVYIVPSSPDEDRQEFLSKKDAIYAMKFDY